MDGLMKGYMLAQWSVWTQQILVVSIEARRKDYWQMIAHHFVTITLIATSYAYHHTRAGNLILVLMDIVEFMFPVSCRKIPSENSTDFANQKARQMSEIPRLHHGLRCHLRPVHRHLAAVASCFLPHGLLERLFRRASDDAKSVLPRHCGEAAGPVAGARRLVALAGTLPRCQWDDLFRQPHHHGQLPVLPPRPPSHHHLMVGVHHPGGGARAARPRGGGCPE